MFASILMDRLNSESSGSEESSLGVGDSSFSSSSSSRDSSNMSDMSDISNSSSSKSSSSNSSSLDGKGSIDSTFIIEEIIQVTIQM